MTRDRIQIPGRPDREMPGGTAYYVSRAWAALGLNVCVVTKVAPEDAGDLLGDLQARGIHVVNRGARHTTVFENRYAGPNLAERHQRVTAVAEPFEPRDVQDIQASVVHLGPLTREEVGLDTFEHLRQVAPFVALDGQGLLREVVAEEVRIGPYPHVEDVISRLDVLKVDDAEAQIMVGASTPWAQARALSDLGVKEVLLTFADRGSALHVDDRYTRVAPVPPPRTVDATGCGDTFVAAYLFARHADEAPEDAARFASAAASLKLADYGPFEGRPEDVRAHLAQHDSTSPPVAV